MKLSYSRLKSQKIRPNNPRQEWLAKNYPGFLHTIFMQGIHAGVYEMNKLYSFGYKAAYDFNLQNKSGGFEIYHFWDLRDLIRVRKIFIDKSRSNLSFFKKIYRQWQKDCQINFKIYQQAEKVDFSSLTDQTLFDWYVKLYSANIKQGRTGYLADCFLTVGANDWLSDFIASRLPKRFNLTETIFILTAPTIASYSNEEAIDLFKIRKSVKGHWQSFNKFFNYLKADKKLWSELVKHVAKYYWLENNYFARILKPKDFSKKLYDSLGRRVDLVKILAGNKIKKYRLLKKIDNSWLANVVKMSELMTQMQDYRKCALVRFSHFLALIFKEMARRTNLTPNDYHNLIFPEIEEVFLKRKIDRQKIRTRIKENFAYGTPKGYLVYEGNELKRYVNKKDFFPDVGKTAEIKGVTGCGGFARGRVKIIKDAHQISNLPKNTVLVTNNTTPEFVPLMKQAVAIVTEQGGITTHAAIVSRELGIPCVIGTKIATQVLRDGDLVEVDANKGIVRKIKAGE